MWLPISSITVLSNSVSAPSITKFISLLSSIDISLIILGNLLNTVSKEGDTFKKGYKYHGLNPHNLENFGDLSNCIEYKKEIFEDDRAPVFKIGAEYNDYNPDEKIKKKNRVLYKG